MICVGPLRSMHKSSFTLQREPRIASRLYAYENGIDKPEIVKWKWKAGLSEVPKLHDRTATVSSTSPEGRNYQKGLVALAKNSASKWIEDKCPQLGAALAYYTVFSLAPLVVLKARPCVRSLSL